MILCCCVSYICHFNIKSVSYSFTNKIQWSKQIDTSDTILDTIEYFCDSDHLLLTDSQLLLSPNVKHMLSSNWFCLVSNISNVTLHTSSITAASITCRHYNNSYETVGFVICNLSELMIKTVSITKYGWPMPSTSTDLYHNDATLYFD